MKIDLPNTLRIFFAFVCLGVLSACADISALAPPTLSPQAVEGRKVFDANCSRCHDTVGDIVVVGPSLAGVASRAGSRVAGLDAAAYIRNSIEDPSAFTVEGFVEGLMPADISEQLSAEELEAVIAYLLTLE